MLPLHPPDALFELTAGQIDPPVNIVPVRAIKPRYTKAHSLAVHNKGAMTIREQKIAQMLSLAEECGYVCEPTTKFRHEFILSITSRMVHRQGKNIYQAAAFPVPLFPRQAAIDMFGMTNVTTQTSSCWTWKVESLAELATILGSMLNEAGKNCAGLTRALTTKSEPTARALAMLIPPFEVSVVRVARGVDRLYVNMMYMLWDQGGGFHPPKDDEKVELEYTAEEIAAFRAMILMDARQLAAQGAPLSSSWCRLIGMELQHVNMVEMAENDGTALTLRAPREKRKRNRWEAECILEERRTTGTTAGVLVAAKNYLDNRPSSIAIDPEGKLTSNLQVGC